MSIDKDSVPESLRTRSSIDIGEAKAQETPVERAEFQLNHSPYETDIPAQHVSVAYNHETGEKTVTPDPCHDPALLAEIAAAGTNLTLAKARWARAKRAVGHAPAPSVEPVGAELKKFWPNCEHPDKIVEFAAHVTTSLRAEIKKLKEKYER